MAKKNEAAIIEIKPINIVTTTVRIAGDTPLIMHRWSEKAKRMILEKQMKKTKGGKVWQLIYQKELVTLKIKDLTL